MLLFFTLFWHLYWQRFVGKLMQVTSQPKLTTHRVLSFIIRSTWRCWPLKYCFFLMFSSVFCRSENLQANSTLSYASGIVKMLGGIIQSVRFSQMQLPGWVFLSQAVHFLHFTAPTWLLQWHQELLCLCQVLKQPLSPSLRRASASWLPLPGLLGSSPRLRHYRGHQAALSIN